MKLCECGCGQPTTISKGGPNIGKPNRYIYGHQPHARWGSRCPEYEAYDVDPESGCWNWQRGTNDNGYGTLTTTESGRKVKWLAHRYMWFKRHGECPPMLDHKCLNVLCCNPDHLRPVTFAQSAQNRNPSGNRNGKSRYRGVCEKDGKWRAYVTINRKQHHLGLFDDEDEAGAAAAAFRAEHMPYSLEAAAA